MLSASLNKTFPSFLPVLCFFYFTVLLAGDESFSVNIFNDCCRIVTDCKCLVVTRFPFQTPEIHFQGDVGLSRGVHTCTCPSVGFDLLYLY